MSPAAARPRRRLIITVCLKESGTVVLPVEPGAARKRLDASAILRELQNLVARRQLDAVVLVREGCAGGCHRRGPNVSLTLHALPAPGERPDNIEYWGYLGVIAARKGDAASATAVSDGLGRLTGRLFGEHTY